MTGLEKGNCSTLYVIVLLLYAVCTVCLHEGLHYTLDQPVLTCTVVQCFKTLKGGEIIQLFESEARKPPWEIAIEKSYPSAMSTSLMPERE